jgi:hypothetical protein
MRKSHAKHSQKSSSPHALDAPHTRRIVLTFLISSFFIFLFFLEGFSYTISGWETLGVVALFALPLALLSPWAMFVLFVASSVIETPITLVAGDIAIRWYQFFGIFVGMGWLFHSIEKKPHIFSWKSLKRHFVLPDVFMAILLGGSIFSSFQSESMGESLHSTYILASCIILYAITRVMLLQKNHFARLWVFLVLVSFFVSILSIFQNIAFLSEWNIFSEVMPGRPNAFFSEPDWLGLYSALMLVVIGGVFIWMNDLKKHVSQKLLYKRMLIRILLGVAFWGMSMTLIMSVSRSAWLAFAGGMFIIILRAFWRRSRNTLISLGILAGIFVIAYAHVQFLPLTNFALGDRAQSSISGLQEITIACEEERSFSSDPVSEEQLAEQGCRHINVEDRENEQASGAFIAKVYRKDPNAHIRQRIWQQSWEALRKHPVEGIGWGSIEPLLGKDARGVDLNASNLFLNIYLGTGLLGFVALLALVLWMSVQSIRMIVTQSGENLIFGIITLSSLAVLGIFSMFNSPEFLAVVWVWLGIVISGIRIYK